MTGDARRGTARDVQRARVYAAENFVRTMFDRAAERGNPVVDFFGASLTLPPEARFSSSETVQRYVDDVLAHPAVRERWPGVSPLRVRARRGHTAAHYDCTADAGWLRPIEDCRDNSNTLFSSLVILVPWLLNSSKIFIEVVVMVFVTPSNTATIRSVSGAVSRCTRKRLSASNLALRVVLHSSNTS